MIGFSDTILVPGSTVHTAGCPLSDERALHGTITSLRGWNRPSPTTAAPSVIAAGGCSMPTLTLMVPLDGSTVGEISRTVPFAVTAGSGTSVNSMAGSAGSWVKIVS